MKNLELESMGVQEMDATKLIMINGGAKNPFPVLSTLWWNFEIASFCIGVSDGWNENKR